MNIKKLLVIWLVCPCPNSNEKENKLTDKDNIYFTIKNYLM